MLNIYWNEYELVKKKKYLIYYVGNFSPPHKCHLSLIEPYFNKKHVKILIHLVGNEEKHNISLKTSMEIFAIYLKNVDNVIIEKFDPLFLNIYNKKIDFLLFIRGNENFDFRIKDDYLNNYDLIKKLRKKGILSIVLFKMRIHGISSTEMCKCIKNGEDILRFLPNNLNYAEINKIKEMI